ncbi:hypothetical protein [Xylanimonas sp. McL0601]|uniref:hypothetical protein n=1 Tax=Xylanimonas sp. McL0601 TaxID=3414739 RepID=UPI003CEAA8C1
MPAPARNSICSSGVRIDFYWWSCADEDVKSHLDDALAALWRAVDGPNRRWTPWSQSMVRSQFKKRLEKAIRGQLVPVDEIKPLRDGRASLFEIRWTDIGVSEVGTGGELVFRDVHVRLIHTEPDGFGLGVVGLHAHEKAIDPDDPTWTRAEQDAEVDTAERCYFAGVGTNWGLVLRQS